MDYSRKHSKTKKEALIYLFFLNKSMKLIIVRHGQTDANISGIIQGHLNEKQTSHNLAEE